MIYFPHVQPCLFYTELVTGFLLDKTELTVYWVDRSAAWCFILQVQGWPSLCTQMW